MIIKTLRDEDFTNYKKASMFIGFPFCSFKCEKECGIKCCQNSELALAPKVDCDINKIIKRYTDNIYTEAVVFGGMEPFDSFSDIIAFIEAFRKECDDDVVIYTGYNKDEIKEQINKLSEYKNIVVKFGRFVPNQEKHFDEVLGINLASPNQYAERIS